MTKRNVNLLHVEDSRLIHRLIAGLLAKVDDYSFAITTAESEEAAFRAFQSRPADLVILDYHLTQGNGLSCLRSLRAIDRVVPILAISGTASAEIAAELLEEGADDFINKDDLNSRVLGKSVRTALQRADIWRQHGQDAANRPRARFKAACRKLGNLLTEEQAGRFLNRIEDFEEAVEALARKNGVPDESLAELLRESSPFPAESPRDRLLLRMLNDALRRISARADRS